MDKDFDIEKITDKMRSLRNTRDLEILNQILKDTELDNQKKLPDTKVLDVKYLGTIEFNGKQEEIYLLLEQMEKEDGVIIEIERYYNSEQEFLGGNNKSDQYEKIILDKQYANEKELANKLEKLDKEGILDLNELEEEKIEKIAKTLGIKPEELEKVSEVSEKNQEKNQETNVDKKNLDKVSSKTEIDASQKVTDKETMAGILNVEGQGFIKFHIVYSKKLKDNNNTTPFTIVGEKEDGQIEKIDTLEQAYGNNPTKEINQLNRDGSKLKQNEQVNSIFRIKGRDETQIAVDIGAIGTIEASVVRTPEQDNQEGISIPIETSNIRPTTRETREFINKQRNPRVKEEIERIKQHQEIGCEEISLKDIDDNPYNNTHEHTEISDDYLGKCAEKILENDEIASVYNRRDVIEKLKSTIEKSEGEAKFINTKEFLERVESEMQENAQAEHEMPNR